MSNIDVSIKHKRSRRSIETKRLTSGITSLDKPFYASKVESGVHKASIYNDTEPNQTYEKHYTNGVETNDVHFIRGQSFTDCFYDEGCDHFYQYVLKDMGYVDKLGFDAKIHKLVSGACTYVTGNTCKATSSYSVSTSGDIDDLSYLWVCTGGTIEGFNNQRQVNVSTDSNKREDFILECAVSDQYTTTIVKFRDSHSRYNEKVYVVMNGIAEIMTGSCEYDSGLGETGCVSTNKFYCDAENATEYIWHVNGSASIVSGQGSDSIVVESDDSSDNVVTVSCTARNADSFKTASIYSIFYHNDINIPVEITDIVEVLPGGCEYSIGDVCTASSEYKVLYIGIASIIQWTVTGAVLKSGQGTNTIVVETTSDSDTHFTVQCKITDSSSGSVKSKNFVHARIEKTDTLFRSVRYDSSNIAVEFETYDIYSTAIAHYPLKNDSVDVIGGRVGIDSNVSFNGMFAVANTDNARIDLFKIDLNSDFSISLWIKDYNGCYWIFGEENPGQTYPTIRIYSCSSRMMNVANMRFDASWANAGPDLHHIVLTSVGTNGAVKVYIDKQLVVDGSRIGNLPAQYNVNTLFSDFDRTNGKAGNKIGNLSIHNVALTQSIVNSIYNREIGEYQ